MMVPCVSGTPCESREIAMYIKFAIAEIFGYGPDARAQWVI